VKSGPPKTPTALTLVKGNPGKRKLPKNEPKPESSAPPPPADLGPDGVKEWQRIVEPLARLGLMTDLDVLALAAYCDAADTWMRARRIFEQLAGASPKTGAFMVRTPNGSVQIAPIVSVIRTARADMVRFAAEFGMTPSARAGMEVDPAAGKPPAGAKPSRDYYD
jgi:P27 family predicted phage terminase small subunit